MTARDYRFNESSLSNRFFFFFFFFSPAVLIPLCLFSPEGKKREKKLYPMYVRLPTGWWGEKDCPLSVFLSLCVFGLTNQEAARQRSKRIKGMRSVVAWRGWLRSFLRLFQLWLTHSLSDWLKTNFFIRRGSIVRQGANGRTDGRVDKQASISYVLYVRANIEFHCLSKKRMTRLLLF